MPEEERQRLQQEIDAVRASVAKLERVSAVVLGKDERDVGQK